MPAPHRPPAEVRTLVHQHSLSQPLGPGFPCSGSGSLLPKAALPLSARLTPGAASALLPPPLHHSHSMQVGAL